MKIQKMVSLDDETARIAQEIGVTYRANGGFSTWLRNQLRSYRNRIENDDAMKANQARRLEQVTKIHTSKLLYHLEQLSEEEVKAVINLLTNSIS